MDEDDTKKTVRTFPKFLHDFKTDDGEQVIGYLGYRKYAMPLDHRLDGWFISSCQQKLPERLNLTDNAAPTSSYAQDRGINIHRCLTLHMSTPVSY